MPAAGRHRGDIVVMDNLAAHKVAGVPKARRAFLLYLPAYSTDLNPIEQAFAKLKSLLRRAAARSKESRTSGDDPRLSPALRSGGSPRRSPTGASAPPGPTGEARRKRILNPPKQEETMSRKNPDGASGLFHACKGRSPMRNAYAGSGGVCPAAISDPI